MAITTPSPIVNANTVKFTFYQSCLSKLIEKLCAYIPPPKLQIMPISCIREIVSSVRAIARSAVIF